MSNEEDTESESLFAKLSDEAKDTVRRHLFERDTTHEYITNSMKIFDKTIRQREFNSLTARSLRFAFLLEDLYRDDIRAFLDVLMTKAPGVTISESISASYRTS